MNVDTGETRIRPAALGALLALLCAMGGCGGSGSSGFDVSPLTESQAIATAIDNQQCVRRQAQVFCASGVEADRGDFEGANVTIQAPQEPLVCDGEATTEHCVASLDFTTEGFMSPNGLLAAVSETEAGPWTLAPLTVSDDLTGPRTVTISVPGETDDVDRKPLIAAVLVYSGAPPVDLPQTAAQLADFGVVELVYVSPRLEVVIPR